MADFRLDWERITRTGTSEAVLCEPKSAAQVDAIVTQHHLDVVNLFVMHAVEHGDAVHDIAVAERDHVVQAAGDRGEVRDV